MNLVASTANAVPSRKCPAALATPEGNRVDQQNRQLCNVDKIRNIVNKFIQVCEVRLRQCQRIASSNHNEISGHVREVIFLSGNISYQSKLASPQ